MVNEEILYLIKELQKYDNKEGYKLEYEDVKNKLGDIITKLINAGDSVVDCFHSLLLREDTWSCLFSLEILKEIKSEKSIPFLINFIKKNEKGDHLDGCENAMGALINIGKPAVELLLRGVKLSFVNREFYIYLVGALTGIKDDRIYNFMKEITEDYVNDYKKYDGWFRIDSWIFEFEKQEKKEIIPLLEELLKMSHLSKGEKLEINDTIAIIKDPVDFNKKTKEEIRKFSENTDEFKNFLNIFCGKKKVDRKEFIERASTVDEKFEVNFRCPDCKERQNIKTGLIWEIDNDKFVYGNEIMCKFCFNHNLELTEQGKMELLSKKMRILGGKEKGILPVGKKVIVENKKASFEEANSYLLKRINEEPTNGELYLRLANVEQKNNRYKEAIEHYEKALELNSKLIAVYYSLIEIYLHRFEYYGIREAKEEGIFYLKDMCKLFESGVYNTSTLRDEQFLSSFIFENELKVGLVDNREIKNRNKRGIVKSYEPGRLIPYPYLFGYKKGEIIEMEMNGKNYQVFDSYCVVPNCNCTEIGLDFFEIKDEHVHELKSDFSFIYNYYNRDFSKGLGISLKEIKKIVDGFPIEIEEKFSERHREIKDELKQDIINKFQNRVNSDGISEKEKIGRNEPCPCGSGEKYKKCCLNRI